MTMITSNMMIGPPRPHRGLRVIQTRHTPARPVRQDLVAVPGAHHGQVVRLADFVADHSRPARPGSWASVLRSASPTRSLESFLYRWATNVDSLGSSVQSIVDPVLAAVGALPSYLEQSLGRLSAEIPIVTMLILAEGQCVPLDSPLCQDALLRIEQQRRGPDGYLRDAVHDEFHDVQYLLRQFYYDFGTTYFAHSFEPLEGAALAAWNARLATLPARIGSTLAYVPMGPVDWLAMTGLVGLSPHGIPTQAVPDTNAG